MRHNEIAVAVSGGHELDQAGLAALIASLPGLRLVSSDQNPPPQILVWNGSPSVDDLPDCGPDTAILLVTETADFESMPMTVMGLLSKDEPPANLGIAIRQVARREQYISPSLVVVIIQKQQEKTTPTASENLAVASLTDREREILDLLAQGLSNKLIATRLYLSVRTVEGHLANIYARLGVHSRIEAMLIAMKVR